MCSGRRIPDATCNQNHPTRKEIKKKEKERQYCARRERSDESVRETGQIESSRRDAYSIRVRTKESPPSPIPDRLLLLPSSAIIIIGSIGLRAGNGALAPPRSSPFYIFFFVSFYSLASTTPLTYLYRTRYDPTVSPSTIIIAIICVAIFSLLLLPLRPSNRMTWLTSRERESSALDLILLSGAQLFNTSIITTMSESLYIVRVHSS